MQHQRFLRYFDEVARAGSIRQAAERLHIAPSAVNRRIMDLEDELGVALFERMPRGMRLTAAGELFARYVRTGTAALDKVRSEIEELQGLRRGSVSIVVSQALAPQFMPRAVSRFRAQHPLVEFRIRVDDHVQALRSLRAYESELALAFNLAREPDIEIVARAEQRLCAIMHRSHPLAAASGGLRLRDCLAWPLVLPGPDSGGRQMLEHHAVRHGLGLRGVVESNSFEFLRGMLREEHAVSFQIAIGATDDSGETVSRELTDRGFPTGHLVLARLHGRQLSVATHAFTEQLVAALSAT